jgi:hypothetical protein
MVLKEDEMDNASSVLKTSLPYSKTLQLHTEVAIL